MRDVGALDGLALSVIEDGRTSLVLFCLCRLMRSLVLILEEIGGLFRVDDGEMVTAPLTDDVVLGPEEPLNSPRVSVAPATNEKLVRELSKCALAALPRRAPATGSKTWLLLGVRLVMGCIFITG